MQTKPAICIQTDFGNHWGAPSSMHGVIHSISPDIHVNDISHTLPMYQPWSASYCLFYTMPCWPAGTIFVSVVDPGVGTARRACVAKTGRGQYIVTPDNGALTHVKALHGITAVREIDETVNRRPGTEKSQTFHGRDLFAYTAGKLAAGLITFEEVGPAYPVEEIVVFPTGSPAIKAGYAAGLVANADHHFGSISTNITIEQFEKAGFAHGDKILVTVTHAGKTYFAERVLYHRSFGFVEVGQPIIYNGLTGFMAVDLNEVSLVDKYHLAAGPDWLVRFEK